MTTRTAIAAGVGAVVLAAGGFATANEFDITPFSATATTTIGAMGCEDWTVQLTAGECFAAGIIRNVGLHNLQGAAQFCKWKGGSPGEWSRLKAYAETETLPLNIVTWFGGSIKNWLEAYFVTGAPTFTILPNTAPNICKTPLAPPVIAGVTPGETDATVTVTTTP
jgi:hypothetical protein